MPKITIDLPADVNEKLKTKAKDNYRSLTNYITVALINLANDIPMTSPGISYAPVFTGAGIPEHSYTITSATAGLVQTPALSIEQLQEQGVSQIKFNKPKTTKELSPEEEQLKQQKILFQQDKMRQQRIKYLMNKSGEILGYILPYLEQNDQKTIDYVLDKYPTNQDIDAYLLSINQDDYDETETPTITTHSDEYIKIKNYFDTNFDAYDFEDMVNNAKQGDLQYIKDYYDIKLHDALGSPHSYHFSNEQWSELLKIITE